MTKKENSLNNLKKELFGWIDKIEREKKAEKRTALWNDQERMILNGLFVIFWANFESQIKEYVFDLYSKEKGFKRIKDIEIGALLRILLFRDPNWGSYVADIYSHRSNLAHGTTVNFSLQETKKMITVLSRVHEHILQNEPLGSLSELDFDKSSETE